MNLADALRSGQLVSRVGGFSYNGYGAATSVLYPDLFLVPSALMVLCGCSITFVYNFFIVSIAFLTFLAMYAAIRALHGTQDEAMCASILYTFANYRLYDLHVNSMSGELLAMLFLPLFTASLIQVLEDHPEKWPFLTLTAYCLLASHLVTTFQCLILAHHPDSISLSSIKTQ